MSEQIARYPGPTGSDVAAFLGRPGDQRLADQAEMHVGLLTTMARSYTRGGGFYIDNTDLASGGVFYADPNDEISMVVILAAARLVTNPAQVQSESADGYSTQGSFSGWTLTERLVLDRYRRKAG